MPCVKTISKVGVLVLLTICNSVASAASEDYLYAGSLCHYGEVEYFNCKLQDSKKIASVCASNNSSPDHGYVQYRFGTQSNIECKYPGELLHPRGRISIIDVSRLSEGLGSHLKFTSGPYTYVVSNALVPGEIYVSKNGKLVFDQICEGNAYIPFDKAVRSGVEYGVVDNTDKLDHHGK